MIPGDRRKCRIYIYIYDNLININDHQHTCVHIQQKICCKPIAPLFVPIYDNNADELN
jgi:hypothetical protein